MDELVSTSPVVLIGTVNGLRFTTIDGSEKPYTEYSLIVNEVIVGADKAKSQTGETFSLFLAGGMSKKGFVDVVGGMPKLELAKTYLLMLRGGKWSLNPISGWNQGVFQLVGLGDNRGQVVVSLNGGVLVGDLDQKLQFVKPDPNRIRSQTRPTPESGGTGGGLYLNPKNRQPDKMDDAKPRLYREDNVEELQKEDDIRAADQPAEIPQISKHEALAIMLGGAKPILLTELIENLQARAKLAAPSLEKLEFSLKPTVLPDVLDSEKPPQAEN